MRIRPAIAAAGLLAGCVGLTPDGAKVITASGPAAVTGCDFLGDIKSTSHLRSATTMGWAGADTYKSLMNQTAKLGGNVLLIVSNDIYDKSGRAYRCSTLPSPS